MSSTYNAKKGDTFERVSRLLYGSELGAASIGRANPGVAEPIPPGTVLVIPTTPDLSQDRASLDPDDVEIVTSDDVLRGWQTVQFSTTVDGLDSITLTAPQTEQTRQILRPFSFATVAVKIGGITQFVGTLIDVTPVVTGENAVVSVSAYATPGVLQDCTMSAAAYESTREFADLTVYQIAQTMSEPLGVRVELDRASSGVGRISPGSAFPSLSVDYGETVWDFIVKIAQERGLLLSNTRLGALLIREQPTTEEPSAILAEGLSPLLSVTPSFRAQNFFSSVTAIAPTTIEGNGAAYTVENHLTRGINRPYVYTAGDATGGNVKAVAESKLQRMIVTAAEYRCEVATWRTPTGKLWTPGSTVSLQAKNAGIVVPFLFSVRGVEFTKNSETGAKTALLLLNIPDDAKGAPWVF